ncbi:MAG: hypothetical protein PWQ34_1240 [Caldanaerobacter sp.]|nr:hypothetical protein [Caldanaerobacter sp.]MDK2794048.1 hypothetical protein [Caldanaerobacter sp.]
MEDASAVIVLIANPKAAFEHIDRVLDSSVELGYMPKERRESAKKGSLKCGKI